MSLLTRMASLLRRFAHRRDGMAAVELGLIGPVFFAMIFAIIDVGGLLAQSMLLDRAVDKAVRTVRVRGGLTTISQTQFRDSVCSGMMLYATGCADRLTVEMSVIKSTANFPSSSVPCVTKDVPQPTVNFNTGARSDMVFVRACYLVDPLVPILGSGLGLPRNDSGGFNVVTTSGFVNEP